MSIADAKYSARFYLPELLEKGRAENISCPVYNAGQLIEPISGTVSILNASGTEVISAAVSVTNSIATYALSASALDNEQLSDGWLIKWSLTMPDGLIHTFQNEASLVRTALYPVVTDQDLFDRISNLNPNSDASITRETDFQKYIDEAWIEINHRLINKGKRPYLVLSPSALRQPHLYLTLALIFENQAVNGEQVEMATKYRQLYNESFGSVTLNYDADNDGKPERQRTPAVSSIWLLGRGR